MYINPHTPQQTLRCVMASYHCLPASVCLTYLPPSCQKRNLEPEQCDMEKLMAQLPTVFIS